MANSGGSRTGHVLFQSEGPNVWTIPPGSDFLGSLARTLARETDLANNPSALSDALIYVPNRRSARALALALHKAAGGGAILPPEIRALGDLETDEPPSGAEEALTDLGPALPPARRLGALAALVLKFYEMQGLTVPAVSAIAAARELARLLDQAALSGEVDWSILPDLVEGADLSSHWQASVEFLRIVAEQWPNWLEENGASEPFERRRKVAEAISRAVRAAPPKGLFIIAGSTGATPATRELMRAACVLENGLVVLPGLDRSAPDHVWAAVREEPDHPQFALAGTLAELGLSPTDVPIWPGSAETPGATMRRRLIHESLAPTSKTADWLERLEVLSGDQSAATFACGALDGLAVIEAANEAEEALLAALQLREALETEGKTAALVTPDAGLARRVAALLKRWNIDIAPSGGVPLGRTQAGALMLLALEWAQDTGHPVRLMALLKHPLVAVDAAGVLALDRYYLRGPRRWGTLADLIDRLPTIHAAKNENRHTRVPEDQYVAAANLLAALQRSLARCDHSYEGIAATVSGPVWVNALTDLINGVVGDETTAWMGVDGEAASRCLEAAGEMLAVLPPVGPETVSDIVSSLAGASTVQEAAAGHPRLAIWGPLEARLQQADRLVLAGLNEGVWPDRPAADAFLPRRFRAPLQIAEPEARLGLAAHDFASLATAPDVTLLYSAQRDDAPAVASRWVLRLKTLVQGALRDEADAALAPASSRDPRRWAKSITLAEQQFDPQTAMPRPTPPVEARPSQLSVTRINTLQRDPYTIYAENILGLTRLDPLDDPLGARVRGTAIHLAIEQFDHLTAEDQTLTALIEKIETGLVRAGQPSHLIAAERASLTVAAEHLFDWWTARRGRIVESWPEARGTYEVEAADATFRLTGIADRIERFADGTLSILDFKTGAMPTSKEIAAGFEQQLPLQVLMARTGAFEGVAQGAVSELGYVAVKYQFEPRTLSRSVEETHTLADQAENILVQLISAYRDPTTPYLSVPRIQLKSKYDGDFDRLARRSEWAGIGDE